MPRVPPTEAPPETLREEAVRAPVVTDDWNAAACATASVEESVAAPVTARVPPRDEAAVTAALEAGQAVFIDFTADWCLTCKANLRFAIETSRVRDVIERNKVVPVLADWTEPSDEIKLALEGLGSKSIPVLAIFPAGRPGEPLPEPIVLRDLLTEAQVLEALERAGPSCCPPPEIRAASTPGRPGR